MSVSFCRIFSAPSRVANPLQRNSPQKESFNLAITLPVGLAGDGLPLAMQLVGKSRGDADLLELAATLEARYGWNGRISGHARLKG